MIFKQAWQGKNCRTGEQFPAEVPGNIQYDYGCFKGFGDIQYADRCRVFRDYEDDAWEYSARLSFDRKEGERVFLVSEGIIYQYEIFLGDERIYSYEGMYKPVELDLTDWLKGDDLLRIVIAPLPKSRLGKADTRDEAAESCMPPVCYGWDWNPRLLISGLWQDVYLETRSHSYIGEVEVLSSLSDDLCTGELCVHYACALPCTVTVFDAEGKIVYTGNDSRIAISNPRLWWCNGQGEAYLYRYEISNGVERVCGQIGFRCLHLVRNIGANGPSSFPKGRYEAPITIELNGRRIFAKGSNWVNPELFWGRVSRERLEELVKLAKDGNMNIFRVWGGAGLAKNEFYDLCDAHGIMVWQEFPLACNCYRGTEHYMKTLDSESVAMIKKLRHHPSLALWCGGNELFNAWSGMDDQSLPLRLLNANCLALDPMRPFLMTSPLFGMAHGGYTFFNERQGGEVFNEFISARNTAYTEFGVPSISSVETLCRIIPEEELFPPRDTEAWRMHHGFGAWGHDTWLCLPTLESYFGKAESLEALVEHSNHLQSEGYRAAFEEARRQWPHCSMAINWCYNEPWRTAANNSVIEYPAKPKPCYTTIREALRPTLFSARIKKFSWGAGETFEAELWLLNDSPLAVSGEVSVSVKLGEQIFSLLSWSAEAEGGRNKIGPTVRLELPNVQVDRLKLILEAPNGYSSTYVLQYVPKKVVKPTYRILNN